MSNDTSQELRTVRLLGLPLQLLNRSTEYSDELFREFRLILTGDEDAHEVPKRLLNLINETQAAYGGYLADQRAQIFEAIDRGDAHADVTYRVPPDAAESALRLDELFQEADAYCRAGDLLTLASPPDVSLFRSWYLHEFARQLSGGDPISWEEARVQLDE